MASQPWCDRKGGHRDFESFREKLVSEGRLPARPTPERKEKAPERKRPGRVNFLWLMADQLRADTFGFAGHPFIKTPSFDRLAREGAVFTNSFCSSPVCMPSRATFLTGHYCFTHGVIQNGCRMREAETVFPTLLREAG